MSNLYKYCCDGNLEKLTQLLNTDATIDIFKCLNSTYYSECEMDSLHYACTSNQTKIIRYLINITQKSHKKFNIHKQNEYLFCNACYKGNLNIVLFFIKISKKYSTKEINIFVKRCKPYDWAASTNEHPKMLILLESLGCYVKKLIKSVHSKIIL
jgi:mRNA degradation ribonuclease J1/J2